MEEIFSLAVQISHDRHIQELENDYMQVKKVLASDIEIEHQEKTIKEQR